VHHDLVRQRLVRSEPTLARTQTSTPRNALANSTRARTSLFARRPFVSIRMSFVSRFLRVASSLRVQRPSRQDLRNDFALMSLQTLAREVTNATVFDVKMMLVLQVHAYGFYRRTLYCRPVLNAVLQQPNWMSNSTKIPGSHCCTL